MTYLPCHFAIAAIVFILPPPWAFAFIIAIQFLLRISSDAIAILPLSMPCHAIFAIIDAMPLLPPRHSPQPPAFRWWASFHAITTILMAFSRYDFSLQLHCFRHWYVIAFFRRWLMPLSHYAIFAISPRSRHWLFSPGFLSLIRWYRRYWYFLRFHFLSFYVAIIFIAWCCFSQLMLSSPAFFQLSWYAFGERKKKRKRDDTLPDTPLSPFWAAPPMPPFSPATISAAFRYADTLSLSLFFFAFAIFDISPLITIFSHYFRHFRRFLRWCCWINIFDGHCRCWGWYASLITLTLIFFAAASQRR